MLKDTSQQDRTLAFIALGSQFTPCLVAAMAIAVASLDTTYSVQLLLGWSILKILGLVALIPRSDRMSTLLTVVLGGIEHGVGICLWCTTFFGPTWLRVVIVGGAVVAVLANQVAVWLLRPYIQRLRLFVEDRIKRLRNLPKKDDVRKAPAI